MTNCKRIGVLTGGGDCPGLNPAIKAVVKKAFSSNIEVLGIRDGWRGAMDPDYAALLTPESVEHIDREGGTILGTTRTNPFKSADGVKRVHSTWQKLQLDGLVAIGGEDTLGVAYKLFSEEKLQIVGIPKTIDRDLGGTEYSLGFESALQVITVCIDTLRSTAESHSRVFVVEVMGRHAGHLALRGGISAGASVILIPECPFSVSRVCELLSQRKQAGYRYSIVVIAEGAQPEGGAEFLKSQESDAFGHVRLGGIGDWLAAQIQQNAQIEARAVNLSHLQRGGRPESYDRRLGFYMGTAAVEACIMGKWGTMAAQKNGRIGLASLQEVIGPLHLVELDKFYDSARYQALDKILGTLGPIVA